MTLENLRLAKFELNVVLMIYIGLMGIHFLTGLFAFGFISESFVNDFAANSHTFFAFFQLMEFFTFFYKPAAACFYSV
ncbi:MAG: hypothetical protein H0X72_03100 [Acidobacteria bacterium]|jgi:hypothetical protein|nr:hypothetical protein [Acidobacteriota bacterium]